MKKSLPFIIFGSIFTAYGLWLCIISNLNLGVLLVVFFGLLALGWGVFYEKVCSVTKRGFFKACKIIVIALLCMELALVSFIAIYGVSDNADYSEDAVIVLGAGINGDKVTLPLKMRLDVALEYCNKNPDAVVVVSGGQGFQETVTEAYAMEKYLVEKGIEKERIIKEEMATSTEENMAFSKKILDERFVNGYSVVVVTNNFHVFRSVCYAKDAGFGDVTHIHGGLQWYNLSLNDQH